MNLRSISSRWLTAAGAIVIAGAGLAAYSNSFHGGFVFDDELSIRNNPAIRHLWPLWPALFPAGGGTTSAGRPLVSLSLALNYAISGTDPGSYHVFNLLIHILAGLALFGVAQRLLARIDGARDGRWSWPAFAVALLWTVHPLQTESVTYIVQRAESMMGLFYLLTLYCFARGCGTVCSDAGIALRARGGSPFCAPRCGASEGEKTGQAGCGGWWVGLSWLACFFGMCTKEVMVTAPVMVLLCDRAFVAGSFREAWRRRRAYYLGLAATWLPLGALVVVGGGNRGGTIGFGVGVSWWAYALTQFEAVARYLRLVFWPHPLIFDYGTFLIRHPADVLPWAALVLPLVAAALWAFWRRTAAGFLGAWFFGILAPTSLTPGTIQMISEHRMYLSLAAVIALVVCSLSGWVARVDDPGRRRNLGFVGLAALAVVAATLGTLTYRRNSVYRSDLSLWTDTVRLRPRDVLAHASLGYDLAHAGKMTEAIAEYEAALRIDPNNVVSLGGLGSALVAEKRYPGAATYFTRALAANPRYAEAHNGLGVALRKTGREAEAMRHFQEAVRLEPDYTQANYNLGLGLAAEGRTDEAVAHFGAALRTEPDFFLAHAALGEVRRKQGRLDEAISHYEQALAADSELPDAQTGLAIALSQTGRLPEAIEHFRAAVSLKPDDPEARANLGVAFLNAGRPAEAADTLAEAVRLRPGFAQAHYLLGLALRGTGRGSEADAQFALARRLQAGTAQP